MSRISSMPTSTSMSISQFLALPVSGLQASGVPDRDQVPQARDPDLAAGVAVDVAVGDAKSRH